jgi:tetratricopeptide (TPR) repeat protein
LQNIIPVVASPAFPAVELQIVQIRELSKLRRHRDALAAAEAVAVQVPQNRDALYLIAANQRCLNRPTDALATLERLEKNHPKFSLLHQERGHCCIALRDLARAIDAFSRAVSLNPALMTSWVMLERLYRISGKTKHANSISEQVSLLQKLPPEVVRAGMLFSDGDLSAAENILQEYRAAGGSHVEMLRLLGRIAHQRKALEEAETLLEVALKAAPNYRAARVDYIRVLLDAQKYLEAHEAVAGLLQVDPENKDLLSLYAAACVGLGRQQRAIEVYRQLIAAFPLSAELHVALGHALQSIGHQKEAIDCYSMAASIRPSFGDAYWSLANLKTYRFSDNEIARMCTEEAAPHAEGVDRYHLCFALGKAYEDRMQYAESWQFYERGNALKLAESLYDPEIIEINARKLMEVCTAEFFEGHATVGAPDPDPIFIVGLPRSGSTLVEQILASHSQVDGTQELLEVPRIVREMEAPRSDPYHPRYPGVLAELAPDQFRSLGERYISDTRVYRGSKPFFIDKMPNNFRHIGLIHLMLPNAKIIDVRREPMACCFSNLKQLFAGGQEFTYRIEDIARYYRMYLELTRLWDAVLPGRVLRVFYEDVVEDVEWSVQRVLQFCGLKFETGCIEFYKQERSVATASSEQVRRPIFRDGLFQWRNYEPWLGSLRDSLGDAVIRYREHSQAASSRPLRFRTFTAPRLY